MDEDIRYDQAPATKLRLKVLQHETKTIYVDLTTDEATPTPRIVRVESNASTKQLLDVLNPLIDLLRREPFLHWFKSRDS